MRFVSFTILFVLLTTAVCAQQNAISASGEIHIPLPTSWTSQSAPNGEIHIFGDENIDRTLPVITLKHESFVESNQNYFTINGTATDASGIKEVLLDGKPIGKSNFSKKVYLSEGNNKLVLTATDTKGNSNRKEIFIQYTTQPIIDHTLPTITFGHATTINTSQKQYTISGTATDASDILMVLINKTQASEFGSGNFSRTVNLKEGNNIFEITALDDSDQKNKATKTVTINYKPQRKDYAILFAIDDYSKVSRYDDLDFCISDAKALQEILDKRFGFEVNLVRNPTKKAMMDTILKYKNKEYGDQDQLLVFYSGHGNINDFDMGYFVCNKGETYEHGTFATQLNKIPCNHILLIADACYSGLIKHKSDGDPSDLIKSMYRTSTFETFRKEQLKSTLKTRKVIASGEGKTKEISNLMPQILDVLNKQRLQYDKVVNFYEVITKIFNADQALWGSFHGDDIGESNFLFIKRQ